MQDPVAMKVATLRAGLLEAANEVAFLISEEAVRQLDADLTEAMVHREISLASSGYRDRYTAHRIIHALANFLQAHPQWRAPTAPLVQLMGALRDLDNGHLAPMLQPTRGSAGRPVSWYDTILRGHAAALVGGLMRHDRMSKNVAAAWVASRMAAAGYEVTTQTLVDWRKDALNHKKHDLHHAYCVGLSAAGWVSMPARAFAEAQLAKLFSLYPQKGE